MRKLVTFTALVATAALAAVAPAVALAAPAGAGGAAFAVSTPSEPLVPAADGTVSTVFTVANNGSHPLTVSLRSVSVKALDDGRVQIIDQPDSVWSKAAAVPPVLRLPAGGYERVPLTIRVPTALLPDYYLVGFLAEAQPADQPADPKDNVQVHNQIASMVTIEVTGPRERHLTVEMPRVGWLHLGSTLDGDFRVRNVGDAAALARGQVRVNSARGDHNIGVVQATDRLELFPAGTSRSLSYTYTSHGLFMLARPKAEVLYGNGSDTMQTVATEGHAVLVLPYRTAVLLGLLLLAMIAFVVWRRRQRAKMRRARQPAHRRARLRGPADRVAPACAG